MPEPYSIGKLARRRSDGSKYWSYCIKWTDEKGSRCRLSLNTTSEVDAETKARRIWGSLHGIPLVVTVGNAVEAYLGPEEGNPDPKPDDKRKREAWAAAKGFWDNITVATLDTKVSAEYLVWRDKAANTMRSELSLIRTALKWCHGQGMLDAAPPVKLPPMPETSVGHLNKEEFRQFLEGCATPHIRLFSMLGITTGGRKTAILQAKWDQVDFKRKLFSLNQVGRRQNSKFRATVPLNDRIMPALDEAKEAALTDYIIEHNGKPCLDIKKGFAAASRRSGIPCHPHMLRHSAAVWMAEDRVPMAEIASFLGHRDINVTIRVYARYHPDYLRSAANSLTW